MTSAFLHCHAVLALCLPVLCLGTGDAPSTQVLVAANVGVRETSILLYQNGNTH